MASVDTTRYGDLCRLCATRTNIVMGINIFEAEASEKQVYKKIESCLPFQIHDNDELPKMICMNCLYKLDMFFEFHQRCIRVQGLLIDLFKEYHTMQMQLEHQMKADVQLEHHMIMVQQQQNALLNDNNLHHHVNEMDLSHLTARDNMIILTNQNVSLDGIELSDHALTSHDLSQELSNQSLHPAENLLVREEALQGSRYANANISYHQETHILPEQYALNDIHLGDNLHTHDSNKENHLLNNHEELPESPEIISDRIVANNVLKEEDSTSENSILIDENKDYVLHASSSGDIATTLENNIVVDKNWLFCNICDKTFRDKATFQTHYEDHFVKCDLCSDVFTSADVMNAHRKEVHGKCDNENEAEEFKKEDNNADAISPEGIDEEEIEDDPDAPTSAPANKRRKWAPKVCKECGKSYKTNYKLAEHMRKHTGETPFKCSTCDKAFRSKIGLAQHEAKHTGQYDYSCSTCGKGFQCKSYLMVHQRAHSDLKPYPCTTCGQNFKTKQSLQDHTNRHLGVKPYSCGICGRSFITNGLCKAHQRVHSGTDNRKYSCKVCSKKFVSKSYLQTHLRIHTGEKPFVCEVCQKGFLTRVDLRIHSTMHTGEKSYVCEICGKAFARRYALGCHRRSHTGERPYSCDICGQTFTQFSPMVIHKRVHTGERPYECETCGKRFISRSTMMVHFKKHDRPTRRVLDERPSSLPKREEQPPDDDYDDDHAVFLST